MQRFTSFGASSFSFARNRAAIKQEERRRGKKPNTPASRAIYIQHRRRCRRRRRRRNARAANRKKKRNEEDEERERIGAMCTYTNGRTTFCRSLLLCVRLGSSVGPSFARCGPSSPFLFSVFSSAASLLPPRVVALPQLAGASLHPILPAVPPWLSPPLFYFSRFQSAQTGFKIPPAEKSRPLLPLFPPRSEFLLRPSRRPPHRRRRRRRRRREERDRKSSIRRFSSQANSPFIVLCSITIRHLRRLFPSAHVANICSVESSSKRLLYCLVGKRLVLETYPSGFTF